MKNFLCPAAPNSVFTYIVENEENKITDLVRYYLGGKPHAAILTTAISTYFPVKQLITDVLVCARNTGVDVVDLIQFVIDNNNYIVVTWISTFSKSSIIFLQLQMSSILLLLCTIVNVDSEINALNALITRKLLLL